MKKMLILALISIPLIWGYKKQLGMNTFYPQTGIVKNVDYENDLVTFGNFLNVKIGWKVILFLQSCITILQRNPYMMIKL